VLRLCNQDNLSWKTEWYLQQLENWYYVRQEEGRIFERSELTPCYSLLVVLLHPQEAGLDVVPEPLTLTVVNQLHQGAIPLLLV
jgi:hypothetical protein